jgi:hypothetical protein
MRRTSTMTHRSQAIRLNTRCWGKSVGLRFIESNCSPSSHLQNACARPPGIETRIPPLLGLPSISLASFSGMPEAYESFGNPAHGAIGSRSGQGRQNRTRCDKGPQSPDGECAPANQRATNRCSRACASSCPFGWFRPFLCRQFLGTWIFWKQHSRVRVCMRKAGGFQAETAFSAPVRLG